MNQTTYEKGLEQGIEKGRREGQLKIVRSMLEDRFGTLSPLTCNQLEQMPTNDLRALALKISSASSLAELGLPE